MFNKRKQCKGKKMGKAERRRIGEDLLELIQNFKEKGKYCFRKEELKRIKNAIDANRNILLVGKQGSGKSYLVESLARMLSESKIQNVAMQRVETLSLLAGTEERGSLESRILGLVNIERGISRLILVFPNMHHLLKAGATRDNPFGGIINMFPELFKKQFLIVIGDTTNSGYKQLSVHAPWIQDKFEILFLRSMSDEDTINSIKVYVNEHSELPEIKNDSFFHYLVQTAKRVIVNFDSPGNAVILFGKLLPFSKSLKEQLTTGEHSGIELVDNVASQSTGLLPQLFNWVPIKKEDVIYQLIQLYKGHRHLLERIVDFFLRFKAHLAPTNRPAASILLSGPTGVGKTELIRVVTRYMYQGDLNKLCIYDMSEYADESSIKSLIGNPSDPTAPGRLIKDISHDPFSIFLFDEIEKAHSHILNLFLQILGDGRLSDPYGNTYSFVNAFIFMSSNIGFQKGSPFYKNKSISKDSVIEALRDKLPRELLNRIEEIFIFDFLDRNTVYEIAEKELKTLFGKSEDKWLTRSFCLDQSVKVVWNDNVVKHIVTKGYSKEFGAREIQRTIEREIIFPLSAILCEKPTITSVNIFVEDGEIHIDL